MAHQRATFSVVGSMLTRRNRSIAMSVALGPLYDHTLGTYDGLYAYTDTSQARHINDTAQLISQSMIDTGSGGTCIEFFYHMYVLSEIRSEFSLTCSLLHFHIITQIFFRYGVGTGALTLYLQKEGFQPIPMWSLTGPQGDDWFQGKVGFVMNSDHSILIESRLTTTKDGDSALDDIVIRNGYCPTFPAYAGLSDGYTTATPAITSKM